MKAKTDRIIKDLYSAIRQSEKKGTSGYDTPAEVTRIEGDTAWVHIPGGVDETPVKMTIGAKKGDTVQVRVSGGSAWLIGNASAPPTDDTKANQIGDTVIITQKLLANTIEANEARFNSVEADTAKIHHLEADEIQATVAYIDDLTANNITAEDITADHATIGSIDAQSISAAVGYIQDLTADNITAQDISADHATINDLDSNYAHITQGVIDNASINYADVDDLNAHYAQVDAANIDTAAIRNAWIDELMVQSGLIAHEGTVYELDAIQVNASKIKAGTLDVERLIVTQNGHKYMMHIDPSTGNPTYQKVDADILEDLTITADKIVAGAITAEKITTENIVGSGGWINLRNGTFQYTNATSGEGITWDGTHLTITGSVTILNSNYYTKTEADNLLSAKRQVFTSQPTTAQAYAVGDLWVNATYGTTYTNDILRCKTAKTSGTAFDISHWEKASKYTDDSNVYTKSDFSITPSAIISKVNANELNLASTYAVCSTGASTTAKVATITPSVTGWALYTGASINVKFTNSNTASAPTLNVNSTGAKRIYAYTGTSALTEEEYKWKAGDTITFFYDGSYWRIQDSTKLTRMSTAETSITQTANSIDSLASNTSTYTKPDGTTGTNSMYTAINQNAESITTLIGRADGVDTLIRAYSGGVLTAKVGNSIGAKVDPDGYFMVVPLTWSGNTPTVGSASLATFGATTRIGAYADNHAYITSNGFSVYTANDAKSRIILGDSSGSPYAQLGSSQDSNYLYLSSSGLSVYSKASGEQSHSSGFFAGLDGTTPLARIGRANDGHISVYPSGISVYKAGATANDDPVRVAYFGSEIRIGAQTARNIYITDTAVNFMNNGADLGYISGTSARFGSPTSSRFVIGASSLVAYNSSNVKYFEVSASGITYGNNIALANASDIPTKVSELTNDSSFATTTQVGTAKSEAISTASSDATSKANAAESNAKKEATNYIYYVSSTDGIVIADASPSTSTRFVRINSGGVRLQQSADNYATMTSNGLTVFQGGAQVGYFGSASRIGSPNDGNLYVSSSGLNVYKKETGDSSPVSIAFFGVDSGSGYSRIGASAQRHIEVTPENGFCLYGANGTEYFRARDSFVRVGANGNDLVRLVIENNYMNFMYRDSSGTDTIREFIGYSSDQNKWYTLLRGTMTIDAGSIILPNDYSYRMKNNSGTDRTVVTLSSGNSYMFGYGGYSNSEGQSYFDGNIVYVRSKGNISFTAGSSGTISGNKAYTNTSDIRLKEDIKYLGEDTDEIILNLKPFKFHWKDKESYDSDDHYGVSAQELKGLLERKELGGIVNETNETFGVAYSELIPMLIHLCQTQQREINELKEKIQ